MSPTRYESIAQAADRTGFSQCTIREWIASGKLPAYRASDKPRSRIRLRVADVDALMSPVIPESVYGGDAA